MARANANRLCPQVNAYAEAPILPSDGHTQMPVAASSLGMLTWWWWGGAPTPTCPAASHLRRPTRRLLLLPRWQLCPLASSSWHVVLPSLRLRPPPGAAALLASRSRAAASLTALLWLPPPASRPPAVIPPVRPAVLALSHVSPVILREHWSPGSSLGHPLRFPGSLPRSKLVAILGFLTRWVKMRGLILSHYFSFRKTGGECLWDISNIRKTPNDAVDVSGVTQESCRVFN